MSPQPYTPDAPTYPLSSTDLHALNLYADNRIEWGDMTPNARAEVIARRREGA